MSPDRWTPHVVVAAVIEQAGRYLLVEEHTRRGPLLNTPGGHLEPGESPEAAVVREALEEAARPFKPTHLVGLYLSRRAGTAPQDDVTYLRLAFTGEAGEAIAGRALDRGVVRTVWLTADELRAQPARLRSPSVLSSIEDHLAGQRYPLALLRTHGSVQALSAGLARAA